MTAFRAHIRELLSLLTEKEVLIVLERLGLDDRKPRTQREISKKLGLTRGAISMAERAAIAKLLEAMGGEYEEPLHDASHGSYAALFRVIEEFRRGTLPSRGCRIVVPSLQQGGVLAAPVGPDFGTIAVAPFSRSRQAQTHLFLVSVAERVGGSEAHAAGQERWQG